MILFEGKKKMDNDLKIKVHLAPQDVAFFTKIFEGLDGLAVVTTLNGKTGELLLTVTPETKGDVFHILNNFPKDLSVEENPFIKE